MAIIERTGKAGLATQEGITTKHCATGSMLRHYAWNGVAVEEEVLLGLGEGVGFIYWHAKGSPPMLGGRADPEGGMEALAAARTGVGLSSATTGSAAKAEAGLLEALDRGESVMLQADMGFLPYFDFSGGDYHFGGHVVLACGRGRAPDTVLIADRDEAIHEVPLEALSRARGSAWKPFPPKNRSWRGDFSRASEPLPRDFAAAMGNMGTRMLEPPIRNMGCDGIDKAAGLIPKWPALLGEAGLRAALFNLYIFASEVGGSGGGNFRHMASRFATVASAACAAEGALRGKAGPYARAAELLHEAALGWDRAAAIGKEGSEAPSGGAEKRVPELAAVIARVAAVEREAWGLTRT